GRVVDALAFDPSGKTLALGIGPTLRLVDAQTGKPAWTVPAHEGEIATIAFSADSTRILTTAQYGRDRAVRLWEAATGKQRAVVRLDEPPVDAFFGADGRTVVILEKY